MKAIKEACIKLHAYSMYIRRLETLNDTFVLCNVKAFMRYS